MYLGKKKLKKVNSVSNAYCKQEKWKVKSVKK